MSQQLHKLSKGNVTRTTSIVKKNNHNKSTIVKRYGHNSYI